MTWYLHRPRSHRSPWSGWVSAPAVDTPVSSPGFLVQAPISSWYLHRPRSHRSPWVGWVNTPIVLDTPVSSPGFLVQAPTSSWYLHRPRAYRSPWIGWVNTPQGPDAPVSSPGFLVQAPISSWYLYRPKSYRSPWVGWVNVPQLVDTPGIQPTWPSFAMPPRRAAHGAYFGLTATRPPSTDLGRFRLGDVMPLVLQGWTGQGAPQAVFTGPGGTVTTNFSTRDQVTYTVSQLLGKNFALGVYTLVVCNTNVYTFTIVPGGDAEGAIISLFNTKTVAGKLVVTQTKAGEILLGLNPRFP